MARRMAVGIDVSSKQFHVARLGLDELEVFDNSPSGRRDLVKSVRRHRGPIVVALESTGPYGLALALCLHAVPRIEIRYINPRAAKGYAHRGMVRSKTDRVDAQALARMADEAFGVAWEPPSEHALKLRSWARRVRTLVNDRTREKNRLKSTKAASVLPQELIEDIEDSIAAFDTRIERLRQRMVAYARENAEVGAQIDLLCSIKGVGEASAVEILAELGCMPQDLTARQLVAQAGLDPRANQSGQRDGPRHISKMGSKYLRGILYMVAMTTVQHCPEVRAFHQVLTEVRHKKPVVAYVAVARKLLHTVHGMLKSGTEFNPARFYQPKEMSQPA